MRAWLIRSCLVLLLCTGNALAGTLLVVGDSISAAFGMDTAEGWVALLEKRLAARCQHQLHLQDDRLLQDTH